MHLRSGYNTQEISILSSKWILRFITSFSALMFFPLRMEFLITLRKNSNFKFHAIRATGDITSNETGQFEYDVLKLITSEFIPMLYLSCILDI